MKLIDKLNKADTSTLFGANKVLKMLELEFDSAKDKNSAISYIIDSVDSSNLDSASPLLKNKIKRFILFLLKRASDRV